MVTVDFEFLGIPSIELCMEDKTVTGVIRIISYICHSSNCHLVSSFGQFNTFNQVPLTPEINQQNCYRDQDHGEKL